MRIVGIGVDVVEVERVRSLLERRPTARDRIFTPQEVAYCEGRATPAVSYAARWAAREACVKALRGVPGIRWRDIRVDRADDGSPTLSLEGTARARADELGVETVLVSLAHEHSVAAAFCVALGAP